MASEADVLQLLYHMHPMSVDVMITMMYRFRPTLEQIQSIHRIVRTLVASRKIETFVVDPVCPRYMLSDAITADININCLKPSIDKKSIVRFQEINAREDVQNLHQHAIMAALHFDHDRGISSKVDTVSAYTSMHPSNCQMLLCRLERYDMVNFQDGIIRMRSDLTSTSMTTEALLLPTIIGSDIP